MVVAKQINSFHLTCLVPPAASFVLLLLILIWIEIYDSPFFVCNAWSTDSILLLGGHRQQDAAAMQTMSINSHGAFLSTQMIVETKQMNASIHVRYCCCERCGKQCWYTNRTNCQIHHTPSFRMSCPISPRGKIVTRLPRSATWQTKGKLWLYALSWQ